MLVYYACGCYLPMLIPAVETASAGYGRVAPRALRILRIDFGRSVIISP